MKTGIRAFVKKLARLAVIEAYWKLEAFDDDQYAAKVVIFTKVPRDADTELVVAEVDRRAANMGGVATRIIREMKDPRRA